ncbi:hypothetical protein LPJ53_002992 [Coemansia erecta]|uniref:TEA domain-containing protein n=1 Tax=Coemansia erecta TaxID=147472 RepID=A0A9W7Y1P8_9FUNG|nr:hypothetical protein LPJ53_002992 [Coemansia erecta]
MDVDTIKELLADLDIDSYIAASLEKGTADEVWSKEIENTFIEAINLFAKVGQRKYQIDPKPVRSRVIEFCGRNDIISRYIFMKTGKYRARKQVSSHIQVWVNCRKPPSSHTLDMPIFTELQKVLRDHYTRASAESHGTPKRKVRRIASTSKVDALKKLGSVCGRSSLGLGDGIGSQFINGTSSSARKHKLSAASDPPAKKLRRVVSEFPHSVLESIVNSGTTKSMTIDDTNIASSPTVFESMDYALHIPKYSHLPQPHPLPADFLSMVANPHFAAQNIPVPDMYADLCTPLLLPSGLGLRPGLGLGLGLDSHYSYSECDFPEQASMLQAPNSAVSDSAVAAAFAGFSSSFSTPTVASATNPAVVAALSDPGLVYPRSSEYFLPMDVGLSLSASPGVMSAFATAIRSKGYPADMDYSLEHDATLENGMVDMDSSFSEEDIQMFTEALKQYCNCIEEAGSVSTLPSDIYYRHGSDPCASPDLVIDENTSPCTRALVHSSIGNARASLSVLGSEPMSDSVMNSALKAHSDPALCPELPLAAIAGSVNFDSPVGALQAKMKAHKGQHHAIIDTAQYHLPAEQEAAFVDSEGKYVSEFSSQSLAPHMLQQDGPMASSMFPYTASLDIHCSQDSAAGWTGGIEGMLDGHNVGSSFFDDEQSKDNVFNDTDNGKCSGGGSAVNDIDTALDMDDDGVFAALCDYLRDAS